jgi:hypothetical protein
MATYFKINEAVETSSGITVTGAYLNAIVHVNNLSSNGTISIDIPSKADLQAIEDNADSIYFRKVGTKEKVGAISGYSLTPEQLSQMDFINGTWVEPVKDALVEYLGVTRENLEVVNV